MLTIERSLMSNLMDDLAKGIYKYLYESSTEFEGNHFVLVPCAHNKEKHYHSLSNT